MFCPKCGIKNEDTTANCVSCGAEIVDNQSAQLDRLLKPIQKSGKELEGKIKESLQSTEQIPSKIKALPKIVKRMAIIIPSLLVLIIVCAAVVSYMTAPKNIVKGYFLANTDKDWVKMYDYLALENTDFINMDSFVQKMENERKSEIVNFEISESAGGANDSSFTKTYTVTYILRGDLKEYKESVTLAKSGKKLIFFDAYNIVVSGLITSNVSFTTQKGSSVYVDDIKLTQTDFSDRSDLEIFIIPEIFSGWHELKVEYPENEVYTSDIQIDARSSSFDISSSSGVVATVAKNTTSAPEEIATSAPEEIATSAPEEIATSAPEKKVTDPPAKNLTSAPETHMISDLFDENGFIFTDGNRRLLTRAEIEKKAINSTYNEETSLKFMINELYARYGADFQNEINRSHYNQYTWYRSLEKHPLESIMSKMNSIEIDNMDLLVIISEEKGYR